MKMKILSLLISLFLISVFFTCDKTPTNNSNDLKDIYVKLKVIDFFESSKDYISTSLANILDVSPLSLNKIVTTDDLTPKTCIQWIKEGYEYSKSNSGKITVWTDSSNKSYQIMHSQKKQVNIEKDCVLKMKSILDATLRRVYQPIWEKEVNELIKKSKNEKEYTNFSILNGGLK